ncbi:MAG: RNA 2',3'-cyclic phosphodiesterase [Gammaproteobacteria bacterium]|nr:RNA 2',3'-cyclic phosphodiesterase [Gammaproteobacteria bacterium]
MRVFYALTLPPLIQEHCLNTIKNLKNEYQFKDIRWTSPDHLHITIRFLENIDEVQLNTINSLLQEQLKTCQAITISTRKLILFPAKRPHIIALAVHLNLELANLVRTLNQTLSSEGIKLEKRPFVAHITLGRFRETTHTEDFTFNHIKTIDDIANRVVLFKSEPTESGSDYTTLKTFQLNNVIQL